MDPFPRKSVTATKIQTQLDKVMTTKYLPFLSRDDPTRIAIQTGTNVSEFLAATSLLYQLCAEEGSRLPELPLADLALSRAGKIRYRGETYILAYYTSPLPAHSGTTFPCPIPIFASSDPKYYSETMLPVLIPIASKNYLVTKRSTALLENILLCPGKFRFTRLNSDGYKYLAAVYEGFELTAFTHMCQDNDFYLPALSYGNAPLSAEEVMTYLITVQTQRVQRGYYAATGSPDSYSFARYGQHFCTPPEKKSYYEKLTSTLKIDESSLPFADYPSLAYLRVYIQKCQYQEGEVTKPILANVVATRDQAYDTPLLVDLRVLDLNFIWQEQKRKRDEPLPDEGYYALSASDLTYLSYHSHSPGVLVILKGYLHGEHVTLDEGEE